MVILRACDIVILPHSRTNPLFLSGSNDIVDEMRIRYCYDFRYGLGPQRERNMVKVTIWLRLRILEFEEKMTRSDRARLSWFR